LNDLYTENSIRKSNKIYGIQDFIPDSKESILKQPIGEILKQRRLQLSNLSSQNISPRDPLKSVTISQMSSVSRGAFGRREYQSHTSNSFQRQQEKFEDQKPKITSNFNKRYSKNSRITHKFKDKFRAYSNKIIEHKAQSPRIHSFEVGNANITMLLRKTRKTKLSTSRSKEKKISPRIGFVTKERLDYIKALMIRHPYNRKKNKINKFQNNHSMLFEDSKRQGMDLETLKLPATDSHNTSFNDPFSQMSSRFSSQNSRFKARKRRNKFDTQNLSHISDGSKHINLKFY